MANPTVQTLKNKPAEPIAEKKVQAHIVNTKNNAVSNAIVTEIHKNTLAVTDATGNFSLPVSDSNRILTIAALGCKSQQIILLPGNSTAKIVMQPINNLLSEAVVNTKQKATYQNNRVHLESAKPAIGWNA